MGMELEKDLELFFQKNSKPSSLILFQKKNCIAPFLATLKEYL
jgi:hypothetical protein